MTKATKIAMRRKPNEARRREKRENHRKFHRVMFVCFLSSAWWFLVMSFEVFLVFLNLLFLLLVSPHPSILLSLWFPSPRYKRKLFSSSLGSIVESWNYSRNTWDDGITLQDIIIVQSGKFAFSEWSHFALIAQNVFKIWEFFTPLLLLLVQKPKNLFEFSN